MKIPKQEYTAEFKELPIKRVKDGMTPGAAGKVLDDRPGPVLAAIVDKTDGAAFGELDRVNQPSRQIEHTPGGFRPDFLFIVAGNDYAEGAGHLRLQNRNREQLDAYRQLLLSGSRCLARSRGYHEPEWRLARTGKIPPHPVCAMYRSQRWVRTTAIQLAPRRCVKQHSAIRIVVEEFSFNTV